MSALGTILAELDPGDRFQALFGLLFLTALEGFIGVGAILFALTREGLEKWGRWLLVAFGLLLMAHVALMWLL